MNVTMLSSASDDIAIALAENVENSLYKSLQLLSMKL
jgi:hypothetical protein